MIIDRDLAELYGVTTKRLNEQVKRNIKRFPDDFMFQVTELEKVDLILQFKHLENLKFSTTLPYAFTEHGAVMLASVLNSDQAIAINIQIVRIFTQIRKLLLENTELRLAVIKLEEMVNKHSKHIDLVFQYIDELSETSNSKKHTEHKPMAYQFPNTP